MTYILAIDPGLTGALAIYAASDPHVVGAYDMPVANGEINVNALHSMIRQWMPHHAYIERVGPMPRDGVRQAWRFSGAYFTARAVVTVLEIPITLITPTQWKKFMKVAGGKEGKEQCRARALALFPSCAESFSRVKDAGRAEAALLAFYAAHHLNKGDTQ